MKRGKTIGRRLGLQAMYVIAILSVTIVLSGCPWFDDELEQETWVVTAVEHVTIAGGGESFGVTISGRESSPSAYHADEDGEVSMDFASIVLIDGVPLRTLRPAARTGFMIGDVIDVSYPLPRFDDPTPEAMILTVDSNTSIYLGGAGSLTDAGVYGEARFTDAAVEVQFN